MRGRSSGAMPMPVSRMHSVFGASSVMETEPLRSMLLQKAYTMYDWLQDHEQTYSVERVRRLEEIRAAMNK